MNKLQVEKKVKNDVSIIIVSIVDAVPVESKNKKSWEAVNIKNWKLWEKQEFIIPKEMEENNFILFFYVLSKTNMNNKPPTIQIPLI